MLHQYYCDITQSRVLHVLFNENMTQAADVTDTEPQQLSQLKPYRMCLACNGSSNASLIDCSCADGILLLHAKDEASSQQVTKVGASCVYAHAGTIHASHQHKISHT